jgi:hypothetical protein
MAGNGMPIKFKLNETVARPVRNLIRSAADARNQGIDRMTYVESAGGYFKSAKDVAEVNSCWRSGISLLSVIRVKPRTYPLISKADPGMLAR